MSKSTLNWAVLRNTQLGVTSYMLCTDAPGVYFLENAVLVVIKMPATASSRTRNGMEKIADIFRDLEEVAREETSLYLDVLKATEAHKIEA